MVELFINRISDMKSRKIPRMGSRATQRKSSDLGVFQNYNLYTREAFSKKQTWVELFEFQSDSFSKFRRAI